MPGWWSTKIMRLLAIIAAAAIVPPLATRPAHASMIVANATGDGWCSAAGFCNNTFVRSYDNMFGGYDAPNDNDWTAVDIPVLTGAITAASLSIWNSGSNRPGSPPDTYYLDQAKGFSYDALVAGPVLGSVNLGIADTGLDHYVTIALNETALSLLTAAEGTNFVFGGGALTGEIFGYTNGLPAPYLTLTIADATTVPEPPALALLGTALLAAGLARRNRRATAWTARLANKIRRALPTATLLATLTTTAAHASSLVTLATFTGANGATPTGNLIADAAGNLLGTTQQGGGSGYGSVFEIAKTGNAYGSPTTLATFNGTNGQFPFAGLIADTAGNLFGTTEYGGTSGDGTVFELAKTGNSYGSPTTLAAFNGTNAAFPIGGLIADAAGNLFGTTVLGGTSSGGTVVEIAKTGTTYGLPTTLATFDGNPYSSLLADANGNLFGTTRNGGASSDGTVFEIAKTGSSYGSPITLASFNGTNGAFPFDIGGLVADAAGNLFGTTQSGGGPAGYGTVFELAKTGNTYGSPITLASFNATNGSNPFAGVIVDAAGDLFGTTNGGGAFGDGTVFEIAKTGSSYGSPITLASFNATNGSSPTAGLVADAAGDLFGTTNLGGSSNDGTVFEITGSGFVTAQATTVPEPPALALLATALLAAGLIAAARARPTRRRSRSELVQISATKWHRRRQHSNDAITTGSVL